MLFRSSDWLRDTEACMHSLKLGLRLGLKLNTEGHDLFIAQAGRWVGLSAERGYGEAEWRDFGSNGAVEPWGKPV